MDTQTLSVTAQYFSIVKDIVVALSAAAAALVAILGLSRWKRELKGRAEYELAKSILQAVYKVRDAFAHVRSNATYQYEYPEEMRDRHGHLKREKNYEGHVHVYDSRWKVLAEAFNELENYHLLAQVEWGQDINTLIHELRRCKSKLQVTIIEYLDNIKEGINTAYGDERYHDHLATLYDHDPDSKYGDFTRQLVLAINNFDTRLRPYIEKRHW